MKKPIVFIGMMGVGKSHMAISLSRKLSIPHFDSDKEIEKAARCSIADIFEIFGEDAFRDTERRVIRRLVEDDCGSKKPRIIATGGGCVVTDETRQRLKEHSYSIWLKADTELLLERTARNNRRPILQTGDPEQILNDLLEKRAALYKDAARKEIDVSHGKAGLAIKDVLKAVYECITEDEEGAEAHAG